jgi:uncharacterized membrane protein YphA (DoxX/SURF4 family)
MEQRTGIRSFRDELDPGPRGRNQAVFSDFHPNWSYKPTSTLKADAMRIVLRLALTLILVLITAFCCFGFMASGELKPDGLANPFRWLYGAMVVACVVAIVAVWRAKKPRGEDTMNILLWVLQVLAAILYGASGVMKVFMFDSVSEGVPSFGALPREGWMALGILELVCTVGLIVPGAVRWQPALTVVAATVLAIESLVFIGVHVKYREITPIILSGVLGVVMAFIAYGRLVLKPIV